MPPKVKIDKESSINHLLTLAKKEGWFDSSVAGLEDRIRVFLSEPLFSKKIMHIAEVDDDIEKWERKVREAEGISQTEDIDLQAVAQNLRISKRAEEQNRAIHEHRRPDFELYDYKPRFDKDERSNVGADKEGMRAIITEFLNDPKQDTLAARNVRKAQHEFNEADSNLIAALVQREALSKERASKDKVFLEVEYKRIEGAKNRFEAQLKEKEATVRAMVDSPTKVEEMRVLVAMYQAMKELNSQLYAKGQKVGEVTALDTKIDKINETITAMRELKHSAKTNLEGLEAVFRQIPVILPEGASTLVDGTNSPQWKKLGKIVEKFEAESKWYLFAIGKGDKAKRIKTAMSAVPLDQRASILDGDTPEKKAVLVALASHRHPWKKSNGKEITGRAVTIDPLKAARAFSEFKANVQQAPQGKSTTDNAPDPGSSGENKPS